MLINQRYFLSVVVLGIFILITPLLEYILFLKPPVIVQFDLKGTTQTFVDSLSVHPISTADSQKETQYFVKSLQSTLNIYATSHHAIILVSPAVMTHVPDITNEIKADLVDQMSKGSQR